jgi:hypothetical protein
VVDDVDCWSAWRNCWRISAVVSSLEVLLVESVEELDDELSSDGGGPAPEPPAPPGPLAKADWNTPFSSVAWSEVIVPFETSLAMRSSIFDLRSRATTWCRSSRRWTGSAGLPNRCR